MLKRHLKALFGTILILFLLIFGSTLLYNSYHIITKGIEFSSKNIDDKYGRLDTNTKLKLEETLKAKMEEKNIEFFFSFVYEDINNYYAKQLSKNDNTVYIYYNDSTKKINMLTNLQLNSEENFESSLTSKEELITFIPTYLDSICNSIQDNSNCIYENSMNTKITIWSILGIGCYIIFCNLVVDYIRFMKRYFIYLNKVKLKKTNMKNQKNFEDSENLENP